MAAFHQVQRDRMKPLTARRRWSRIGRKETPAITESACSTAHIDADLALIGFGKGAETLAATLGRQGWRVAMIEQSAQMDGGTCINFGCVPTKSLVYQAEQLTEGSATTDGYRHAVSTEQAVTSTLWAENFKKLKFGRTRPATNPPKAFSFQMTGVGHGPVT